MRRTEMLQEIRTMRFEEVLDVWKKGRLAQEEAAIMLGVCDRTFRRYINRYDEGGLEALQDRRLTQASARAAPVDEVMALLDKYKTRYRGWNVKHFHSWYKRDGGERSYTWVKNKLQESHLVAKGPSAERIENGGSAQRWRG